MPHEPGVPGAHMPEDDLGPDVRRCIDACLNASATCDEALARCRAGHYAGGSLLRDLMDCALLCRTAADLMLRGSGLHRDACAVAADACDFCADSVARLPADDVLRRCVDATRRCAAACRQIAGVEFPA
jgi:hypothetical protein